MERFPSFILIAIGMGVWIALGGFAWFEFRAGERKAPRRALVLAVLCALPFFLATILPQRGQWIILGAFLVALFLVGLLFTLSIGQIPADNSFRLERYDERDVVFARARLVPGSQDYEAYYTMRRENLSPDERFRALPGLLSMEAKKADPLLFPLPHSGKVFPFIGGDKILHLLCRCKGSCYNYGQEHEGEAAKRYYNFFNQIRFHINPSLFLDLSTCFKMKLISRYVP